MSQQEISIEDKKVVVKDLNEAQKLMAGIYNMGKEEPAKVESNWDDLEALYQDCGQLIIQVMEAVHTIYATPGLIEHVSKPDETRISISAITKDLQDFTTQLVKIHSEHEGKTGIITDDNEISHMFQIFELYTQHQQMFQSVVIPNYSIIAEEAGFATTRMLEPGMPMSEVAAETEEQIKARDPMYITDVVVKEVVSTPVTE